MTVVSVGHHAVVSGKMAEAVWPSGTSTVAGTGARTGWEELKLTIAPPAGAGPSNVTLLLFAVEPPTIEVWAIYMDDSAVDRTVKLPVFDTPP